MPLRARCATSALSAWLRRTVKAATGRRQCTSSVKDVRSTGQRLQLLRLRLREETAASAAAPLLRAAGDSGAPTTQPLIDTYDRQHRYLRVSLTERCNLRCSYCMPEAGVPLMPASHMLQTDEMLHLVRLFHSLGVNKVRLTGGEPTLRRDLTHIVKQLKDMGLPVIAMTSNGITLPSLLPQLHAAGLTHVNISLDTLRPSVFAAITRRSEEHWQRAWSALHMAASMPFARVKMNVVVMRGVNDTELPALARVAATLPVDVRFIELMPFHGNAWAADRFISSAAARAVIEAALPGMHPAPGNGDGTSKDYIVPGFMGRIGFISSMSDHFCGSCDRLRLTADGKLKVCLHGDAETDLLKLLRAGAPAHDLQYAIAVAVRGKHRALGGHADMTSLADSVRNSSTARPMIRIGG